jgi:hypothetical protein
MPIVGFRANPTKHGRILMWLQKFENQSEECRRLMELAIDISEGRRHMPPADPQSRDINWSNFPKKPTIK